MSKRVLVVGDVILDRYTSGRRLGLSAETPTIVGELEKEETYVGGAGLVARHLLALGCETKLLTVTGRDQNIEHILNIASDPPQNPDRLIVPYFSDDGWRLTEKRRYFVEGYKLLQFDVLNRGTWTSELREKFFNMFREHLAGADAVVFCDNRHGVMDEWLARVMLEQTAMKKVQTYVDVQVSQSKSVHWWYAGANYMFMNERELVEASKQDNPLIENASQMITNLSFRFATNIVHKMGVNGSVMYANGTWTRAYPFPVNAVDTCGAGDAFLAAFVACEKTDPESILSAANSWASRSCKYRGTVVPNWEEYT